MVNKKPRTVQYRRKRELKTSYKQRLRLLLAEKPRLTVRFTNSRIIAQLVEFSSEGDKVLVAVDSSALSKIGWNFSTKNLPSAYLVGLMIGKKSIAKNLNEVILDVGLRNPIKKGKVYAFLKGVIDSGLKVPYGEEDIFPSLERISGKDIQDYALKIKDNKVLYEKRFGKYLKNKAVPDQIVKIFSQVKDKLMKGN